MNLIDASGASRRSMRAAIKAKIERLRKVTITFS